MNTVYIKKIILKLRGDCCDAEIETNRGKWHVFVPGNRLNSDIQAQIPETVTIEDERKAKYKDIIAKYLQAWGYQKNYFDSENVMIVANQRVNNPILAFAFLVDSWTAASAQDMKSNPDSVGEIEVVNALDPNNTETLEKLDKVMRDIADDKDTPNQED